MRVERPCDCFAWSYEVVDTKLALTNKPYFIIQLENYSEHLARVQGGVPHEMHVVLGNGRATAHRVEDYAAYYRHLKASFLETGIAWDGYPYPCAHCDVCGWNDTCQRRRVADDHLSLVAGMRRSWTIALEENGVPTLAALGTEDAPRPPGMQPGSFDRLQRQAALQLRGRRERADLYEILEQEPSTGFGLLPPPADGDVFFDMEGDPLFEIGTGLEYLFGFYCPTEEPSFVPFWGTDRAREKTAFEGAVDFIVARRARYPTMHVYHYAPYEKTALRRLAQRHGTRESDVDDLLRAEVLVDLYAVVRQSVLISQSSYSIKKLETYYDMTRTSEVKRGDDSVLQFETWLDNGDDAILEDIAAYNEEDCRSTYYLLTWLLERRAEYAAAGGRVVEYRALRDGKTPCHETYEAGCKKCEAREKERVELEKLSADQVALAGRTNDPNAVLLSHLLSYHRREEKPVWWALFDRCENVDKLVEFDREAIGDLELRRDIPPESVAKSKKSIFTYSFPEQMHHLGDEPYDPATVKSAGEIVGIDEDTNTLRLKRTGTIEDAARITALIPGAPIRTPAQRAALARLGEAYLAGDFARTHPAANDLLSRTPPRLLDRPRGARLQPAVVTPESVLAVVRELDDSYLFVQGPPGTGKTYTGARVIVALLRAGKRVGVMANSHKAMHNMLHAIEAYALECGLGPPDVRGLHKHSISNDGSPYVSRLAEPLVASADDAKRSEAGEENLLSGNAWLFAREGMAGRLDYLFIDEAGQVSLADALSVTPAARNTILLGDPMQLSQVSQGQHLENAGRSVLEHLLGDRATIAEDRGILLDVSYRMEPSICAFISDTMYESRLHADPPSHHNRIDTPYDRGGGLRYLPVTHDGNGRESLEEARGDRGCGRRTLARNVRAQGGAGGAAHRARRARRHAVQRAAQAHRSDPRCSRLPERPRRHGRQVSRPRSARGLLLDGDVERRRVAAQHGVSLRTQSFQRCDFARTMSLRLGLLAAAARHSLPDDRADAARQRRLPLRRSRRPRRPGRCFADVDGRARIARRECTPNGRALTPRTSNRTLFLRGESAVDRPRAATRAHDVSYGRSRSR